MSIVAVHGPTMLKGGGGTPPAGHAIAITAVEPYTFPEDTPTTLVITGSFNPGFAVQVTVGAVEYPATIIDDTHISVEATVAAGGDRAVVVADEEGWFDTFPIEVVTPAPMITTMTPSTCALADAETVPGTLIGSGFTLIQSVLSRSPSGVEGGGGFQRISDTQINVNSLISGTPVVGDYHVFVVLLSGVTSNEMVFTVTP